MNFYPSERYPCTNILKGFLLLYQHLASNLIISGSNLINIIKRGLSNSVQVANAQALKDLMAGDVHAGHDSYDAAADDNGAGALRRSKRSRKFAHKSYNVKAGYGYPFEYEENDSPALCQRQTAM